MHKYLDQGIKILQEDTLPIKFVTQLFLTVLTLQNCNFKIECASE